MLARLCQLKSPVLLSALVVLGSCSWPGRHRYSPEVVTKFPTRWFSVSKNHTILDADLNPVPHVLFDTTPEFEPSDQEVNVVIATPEESEHIYAIDLQSGQRYYSHSVCSQNDVWGEFKGEVFRPRFSLGYIPRVLDQMGTPQKVVVWSKRSKIREFVGTNFHKVRLIGAYVEQLCPEGNCIGRSNWLSRLVFLAVDADDSRYESLKDIKEFRDEINWQQAKAFLSNMEGRNLRAEATFPTIRIGELISYKEAFDYFKQRSIFLTDSELKKIQKSCHALYDKLWDDVGATKQEDRPASTTDELREKIKLREDLKKKNLPVGFAARFTDFTRKYFNEISTCDKFVYHGNINQDIERFWFFSYVSIFYRLHREGYYFDCRNKAWLRNIPDENGRQVYDFLKGIENCGDRELDQAMDYLPNFLAGLKGEKDYFRFIDYDNHSLGSHKKLYTWVKAKTRHFVCDENKASVNLNQGNFFPEDVVWKERRIKDIADSMKIIY
jgi:hypothetical protein